MLVSQNMMGHKSLLNSDSKSFIFHAWILDILDIVADVDLCMGGAGCFER